MTNPPFQISEQKRPDSFQVGRAVRARKGIEAEIHYLQKRLTELPSSAECIVALSRALRLAGRVMEAHVLLQNFRTENPPAWLSAGVMLERIFVTALRRKYDDSLRLTKDYAGVERGDITSLWIQVTREIARTLDFEAVRSWLQCSVDEVNELAEDKIRVERYVSLVSQQAWKEFHAWECDDDLKEYAALVVRVEFHDLHVEKVDASVGFKRLLCTAPDESIGIEYEVVHDGDLALFSDPRLSHLQTEMPSRYGWKRSIAQSQATQIYSLSEARVIEYLHDNRGGIVYGNYSVNKALCNEHYLLDIMGHCKIYRESNLIEFAYAPFIAAPGNYYHEIIDTLGSMMPYFQLGLNCPILIPLREKQYISLYERLGLPPDRIVTYHQARETCIKRLIAPRPLPITSTLISFLRWAGALVSEYPTPQQESYSCGVSDAGLIYLSRRRAAARRLLNEEEIEAALSERGFNIVFAEDLDVWEQVKLFNSAKIIVAPHGAGLTNIVFCPSGTPIVEMLPEGYPNPAFFKVANACGHRHILLVGTAFMEPGKSSSGWKFNVDVLLDVVSRLLTETKIA